MRIWLIRAGQHGEHEQKFVQEKRVYVTWEGLGVDLSKMSDRKQLIQALEKVYPGEKQKRFINWASQIWPFAHKMETGDWVVMPLKTQPSVYIGEITGPYNFEKEGPDPYFHWRSVKWIGDGIPRSNFSQDLLYSFGAFMTICRIKRNNAESRFQAMRANGWKPEGLKVSPTESDDEDQETYNFEELAQDSIAKLITARFKGHGFAQLVEAILKAQGYTTYRSPEGADGGVDILAGAAPLGFGRPRICVQVKSQDAPISRPEVDQLMGVMKKMQADEGLFVAWGGFKPNVPKEMAGSFFSVRLWNRNDLLRELFDHYDKLDDDLKAKLPLKRIWTVASEEETE